jgi:hypothetical protein
MAKLDWRRRNKDAVRRLRGEDVALELEPLHKQIAIDFGASFGEPARLLCPTCGSFELAPRGVAQREGALCAFFRCACGVHFGLEFVLADGAVTVGIYEPSAGLSSAL